MAAEQTTVGLFDYFPEDKRSDPAVKEYVGLLAGYSLARIITESEATQLAAHAGGLLRENERQQ